MKYTWLRNWFWFTSPRRVQATLMTITNRRVDLLSLLQFHGNRSVSKINAYMSSAIIPDVLALPIFTTLLTLDPSDSSSTDTQSNFLCTCCCNQLTDSSNVFKQFFSLPLFTFTYIALLLLYKYLFEMVRGIILLFVFEYAVHTFPVTDL
jgi:hypothetical protein